MSEPLDRALVLMRKASNDMFTAEDTLAAGRVFDTVCFHAQQMVEKSLKALLSLENVDYPRTHDLRRLLEMARPLHPGLAEVRDDVIGLSPFAVDMRYGEAPDPSAEEATEALESAKAVYALAEEIIAERAERAEDNGQDDE